MNDSNSGELQRHLTFKDIFFLSFGGMSPLLSILTYGAFAFTLAGYDAPIVMVIGTLLVLINGLSVNQLSKRFSTSGGYYTYAFQALSANVGFDTGWMYMFYSILYGLAYLAGAVFVISLILGIPVYFSFLIISVPSVILLIIGIKTSSRYAIYAVTLEVSFMAIMVVLSFFITHGNFYTPSFSRYPITSAGLFLGILFAMGIPTGYGTITPISGEAQDAKRVIGRSVIAVILSGGILATVVIYAFANIVLQTHYSIPFSDKLPIIDIIRYDFGKYGIYLYYAVAIATVNDAILAFLSFGSAASRTLFRMGYDRTIPSIFSKNVKNNPIVSVITVSIVMMIIPALMFRYMSPEIVFIFLGTVASLAGLFIHLSANFSLMRIGYRRGRRLISRMERKLWNYIIDYREFILASVGALVSSIVLVYSAYSTVPYYTTIFLTWVVIGFILSEVKAIVTKTPYMPDIGREGKIVAENLTSMTVAKARNPATDVIVNINDTLRSAMEKMLSKNMPASIVVNNESKPIGTVYLIDILLLPQIAIEKGKINQIRIEKVVNIGENENITDAIRLMKENNVPLLAIIDASGKCTGTVSEREVLLQLGTVKKDDDTGAQATE